MSPRVTVAIPTYNRSHYLAVAVRSVLAQTVGDFEIVVLDNASTDDTREVVAGFADERISYDRAPENVGLHGNFNRCLRAGTAPYLAILQDDDFMLPRNLEAKVGVLESDPTLAFVTGLLRFVDADGRVTADGVDWWEAPTSREHGSEFIARTMRKGLRAELSSAVVRRSLLPPDGFDVRDGVAADYGFFLRLALRGDAAFVRETLSASRRHAGTVSVAARALVSPGGHYAPSIEYVARCHSINERLLTEHPHLPGASRLRRIARRWAGRELGGAVRAAAGRDPRLPDAASLVRAAAVVEPRVLATPRVHAVLAWAALGRRGRALLRRVLPPLNHR